jgi:hypothetical protein
MKFVTCEVKDVLSDVAADQNDALLFFEVHGLEELTARPKVS